MKSVDDMGDLPESAQTYWNIKKEEKAMPVKKTETTETPEENVKDAPEAVQFSGMPGIKVTLHAPKCLWDVLGAVSYEVYVKRPADVVLAVEEAHEQWENLKADFEEELSAEPAASPRQMALLTSLYDGELPEDMEELTMAEASAKIKEMQDKGGGRGNRGGGRSRGSSSSRSSDSGRGGGSYRSSGGGGGRTASDKTFSLMRDIADRADIDLPEDYENMTQNEASDWIKENQGSGRRRFNRR